LTIALFCDIINVANVIRKWYTFNITAKKIEKKEVSFMSKYECVCGYVYDPAEGDPDSGIAPGTPFESIPDDWVCPVCGATKDAFSKL